MDCGTCGRLGDHDILAAERGRSLSQHYLGIRTGWSAGRLRRVLKRLVDEGVLLRHARPPLRTGEDGCQHPARRVTVLDSRFELRR